MKEYKVIELSLKAGFKSGRFKAAPVIVQHSNGAWICVTNELQEFAKLVEQETLERAAKVCESWRGGKLLLNAGEMSADELRTVRAVTEAASREIRALKTQGE